jgi:transcriptional antiterminator NusG
MNMQLKNVTGEVIARKESVMKLELGWADVGLRMRLIELESRPIEGGGHWFCLSVMSGREEAVEKALALFGIEALVPMRKGHKVSRRGRVFESPALPVMRGYALVKLRSDHPSFHGIKGIRHVIDVVGGSHSPMRVSEVSVNEFKKKAHEGAFDIVESQVSFVPGETVRVTDGPFTGFLFTVKAISAKAGGDITVNSVLFGGVADMRLPLAIVEKV